MWILFRSSGIRNKLIHYDVLFGISNTFLAEVAFPTYKYKNQITMSDTMNELIEKVKQVIEEVRPYLQGDGGDVEYVGITDDMRVQVRLKGACGSCPFRLQTLKNGVEQAVQKVVPEVKEVVAVD